MPILLIETSTERSVVGIVEAGVVLFDRQLAPGLNQSKYLASALAEGLQQLNVSMKDMDYVAVGIGPGSYTGIRIGAMLAKSLAFAAEIPLVGVSTLECFSPTVEGPFSTLIDAKISGAYNIGGIYETGKIAYAFSPQVTPLEQLRSLVEQFPHIVTPHIEPLKSKLLGLIPEVSWEELSPNLLQMASVAEIHRHNGRFNLDGTLDLLYLRKTQAELEKQEKQRMIEEFL